MPADSIIIVTDMVKKFGDQTVLDGVNLDVLRGETMVIMGGSGSGKSTMLRLMIGSIVAEHGSVCMFGQDMADLDEDALNALRKKFGILFQSGALFNSMTIAENVALPLQEHTSLSQETIDIMVKIKLELVLTDKQVETAVNAIVKAAKTGKIGDGKVFVSPIEQAVRIRTDEHGDAAI